MEIQLHFALTPDDYCEFQRAYMKNRRSLRSAQRGPLFSARLLIWLVFMGLLLLVFALIEWIPVANPAPAAAAPAPVSLNDAMLELAPYVILSLAVWAFLMWLARSRFLHRRLAAEGTRIGQPKTVEITQTQIAIRQTHSYTVMEWPHFIRCIETANTFLLFEMPRLAHILPKRGFPSNDAIIEFRQFAQANVGNQPIGFPVQPSVPPPMPADISRTQGR